MRILVVEDEKQIADNIRLLLVKEKYVVDVAPTLAFAREALSLSHYDVVILDRMLPDGEGTSLVKYALSSHITSQFIILSALADVTDKVEGLDLGADDYLAKPFEPDELLARIRAAIRRPLPEKNKTFHCANVTYHLESRTVYVNQSIVVLSSKELSIFEALIRAAGRVVTHEVLEQFVYNFDDEIQSNTIASHISRMRKVFEHQGACIEFHASRGIGYMLRKTLHD